MSKELYFTDGNNEVKYLDTTASFNLAITQDGSAFDLTNATAIDVKVANDTGYVFDKSIDMATIKQPLAGLITMPVDAEVMNALVPDDYTIEVWVTLSSLITPGSQEGLTDTSTDGATSDTNTSTTNISTTDTTTYNAIFPSDDPQGFTITENVMSDSGDVIPVMSLDAFQQEFEQLKTDLTNQVSTLQGPAGKDGENGKDGATGPQGPQGIQGPKGDTGQGLEIKGKVDTTDNLPATASEGDGYLVAEELYIWTNNAWKDCGQIQGPAGKDGATGPQGPKGDTGATGAQGIQGPKGDTGETGPAGKDGTAKFEELAEGTDLFSLVVNDAQSHYYLCSSNASAKTLKNSPVATAFSLELYPANTPQSVASNGVAEWAYTQMVLRPFNSSTAWIASTNSDGSGNISNTVWVQVASMSDVTTAISTATENMVDSNKPTNFTSGLQSGGVDVATAADLKSVEDSAWRPLKLLSSTGGIILFKDNGDGSASLSGSAVFDLGSTTDTYTAGIYPPEGYTFSSVDWPYSGSTKGMFTQYAMTKQGSANIQQIKVKIENNILLFGGSNNWNQGNLLTFNRFRTNFDSMATAGDPAIIAINKLL